MFYKLKYTYILPLALGAGIVLAGCSTAHRVAGINLNGSYKMDDINIRGLEGYSGKEVIRQNEYATLLQHYKLNTLLFDDVAPQCFVNSLWVLPHNGMGSYTIQNSTGNCYSGLRKIVWSVRTENDQKVFQLKILDGQKARKVAEGYRLYFGNADQDGFELHSQTTFEGRPVDVYYHFTRVNP